MKNLQKIIVIGVFLLLIGCSKKTDSTDVSINQSENVEVSSNKNQTETEIQDEIINQNDKSEMIQNETEMQEQIINDSQDNNQVIAGNNDPNSQTYLTEDEAKSIMLQKVLDGKFKSFEFEIDDGVAVYEAELTKDRTEYDITIDAVTGQILEYEEDSIFG